MADDLTKGMHDDSDDHKGHQTSGNQDSQNAQAGQKGGQAQGSDMDTNYGQQTDKDTDTSLNDEDL